MNKHEDDIKRKRENQLIKKIVLISINIIFVSLLFGSALSYDFQIKKSTKIAKIKSSAAYDMGIKMPPPKVYANSCTQNDDKGPIRYSGLNGESADGVVQITQNEKLTMFYEQQKGSVYLEDRVTGEKWYSYPQKKEGILSHQLPIIENPVTIRYTQGTAANVTYPHKEAGILIPSLIDNGVRVHYTLTSIGINFAIDYRLTSDGFEVSIPTDFIEEEYKCKLISLEPLPYFDAAHTSEEGYLFIPDGSGALVRFKENHLDYFDRYYQTIYGGDIAYDVQVKSTIRKDAREDVFNDPREKVTFPVIGMKRGDQGFIAIVTAGEHDANVISAPSGYQNVPFYRTSIEFTYRNQDIIYIGDSGEIPFIQGQLLEGPRSVHYKLLQGEDSGYVGMAHAYRDHIMKENEVKPVIQEQVPIRLHLLGGIIRDEIIGKTYISMTTFNEMKDIVDRFADQGITQLELVLEGWSDGGLYGSQPKHFPVSKKLGGMADLKQLIQYSNSRNIRLYLQTNYVRPYIQYGSYKPGKDAIQGMLRQAMIYYDRDPATLQTKKGKSFHVLNPLVALEKYLKPELDQYNKLNVNGLHLDYIGELLYSDLNKNSIVMRDQTIQIWQDAMDESRQELGHVSVSYGLGYTVGHVDFIDNVPMESSHFIYEDESVPFYQIVMHGLVPYSGDIGNLRDDSTNQFLKMIEYGAAPQYRLTFQNSSMLKRTPLDDLLSSDVHDWIDIVSAEYIRAVEALDEVKNESIIGHELLYPGVYATTYSNGDKIVVNYNEQPRYIDSRWIDSQDFAVIKGGDK